MTDRHLSRLEKLFIYLVCAITGLRIFVFAAAFPFFSNVDEQYHFDLIVKYAKGEVPQKLEKLDNESVDMIVRYGSPEYMEQDPFAGVPPSLVLEGFRGISREAKDVKGVLDESGQP